MSKYDEMLLTAGLEWSMLLCFWLIDEMFLTFDEMLLTAGLEWSMLRCFWLVDEILLTAGLEWSMLLCFWLIDEMVLTFDEMFLTEWGDVEFSDLCALTADQARLVRLHDEAHRKIQSELLLQAQNLLQDFLELLIYIWHIHIWSFTQIVSIWVPFYIIAADSDNFKFLKPGKIWKSACTDHVNWGDVDKGNPG